MQLNEVPDQRQADAEAGDFLLPVGLVVAVEYMRNIFGRNTKSGVRDFTFCIIYAVYPQGAEGEGYFALVGVFKGGGQGAVQDHSNDYGVRIEEVEYVVDMRFELHVVIAVEIFVYYRNCPDL